MKVLGTILYFLAFGLSIWIIVCSFSTWIAAWGAGGFIFDLFLLPIAVLLYPFMKLNLTGQMDSLLGYIDIAVFFILLGLAGYFAEKD